MVVLDVDVNFLKFGVGGSSMCTNLRGGLIGGGSLSVAVCNKSAVVVESKGVVLSHFGDYIYASILTQFLPLPPSN